VIFCGLFLCPKSRKNKEFSGLFSSDRIRTGNFCCAFFDEFYLTARAEFFAPYSYEERHRRKQGAQRNEPERQPLQPPYPQNQGRSNGSEVSRFEGQKKGDVTR
jgi:hypothetical protein